MLKKIKILVLSNALCLVLICLAGCQPETTKIKSYPGGLKVIIQRVPESKVSALQFWIKTGAINENPEINGISHFLEHLLFKGTKNRPRPNQIFTEMENEGAYFNAATSYDFTYYYIDIPAEKTLKALNVLTDLTLNPLWPAAEIEKERKVVIEELRRGLDDPDRELYDKHAELIFGKNHPYGRTVIGPQSNLEKISRDQLIHYFKTYYTPSQLTIVIAGPVTPNVL
jgi:predicted Zn-dependent peptidase